MAFLFSATAEASPKPPRKERCGRPAGRSLAAARRRWHQPHRMGRDGVPPHQKCRSHLPEERPAVVRLWPPTRRSLPRRPALTASPGRQRISTPRRAINSYLRLRSAIAGRHLHPQEPSDLFFTGHQKGAGSVRSNAPQSPTLEQQTRIEGEGSRALDITDAMSILVVQMNVGAVRFSHVAEVRHAMSPSRSAVALRRYACLGR